MAAGMEFSSNNALKRNLEKYAAQYATEQERQGSLGDGRSSIHYPALFLFVGDQVAPAVSAVQEINRLKWDNGEGVVYVQIGTEDQDDDRHRNHDSSERMKHDNDNGGQLDRGEHSDDRQPTYPGGHRSAEAMDRSSFDDGQVTRHVLPISGAKTGRPSKTLRKDVHRSFHDSDQALYGLNRTLRRVSNRIAEYGRLYSSFDRIYVTVVTRADDPLNVLLPELTKLTETILGQSFKSVQTDLHVLVSEMEQVDSFGYASAAGLAFLRELDYMQGLDYTFSGNLLVTEDGISIPVVHPASPLFDLVYILSDKNERGTGVPGGWIENAEIICRICLLKNRKQEPDSSGAVSSTGANTYNNTSFKNNIRTTSDQHGYASAGFAEIRRPNKPIALAVLYHLYRYLLERMRQEPEWSIKDKLVFFGLDGASVERKVEGILPDEDLVSGMSGIMTHNVSFTDLKPLSLREAERALFGHGAEAYFRDNVVRLAEDRVRQRSTEGSLRRQAEQSRTEHPEIGYFQWAAWSDNGFGSVREALLGLIRDKSVQLESARSLLEQRQQERVEDQSFKRALFRDKQNVRNLIDCLLERVYVPKVELLRLENELQLLRVYDTEMEHLHTFSRKVTETLAALERTLRETALESIAAADEYIGQNVMEYYGKVTEALIADLEAKRGRDVWFEDRYMGDMNRLATEGNERLLQRLMEVCHAMLLTADPLRVPFEEELLLRANVTITYGDKNVLTRDDLFRRLYRTLEEQAVVRVRVFDYTQEHRYEEKYFFGDHHSAFMDYAAHAEETSRIYKLGVVYEERSSGVEKLNLMGGFHLEDLMVYRNGRVYYDSYTENGYELHPSDLAEKLSPMR
ncbi:MAG TPA: transcription initiation factor TFIID [Paenibacillus sp.]|uniref:transcription initiation factor TFIID n=1 Tax=Paenibacillus TaxID=44249 RepID=UPI000BA1410F|nr:MULTISPECIES: transcription initiation factor TFIID [Paenibacillus]OZQ59769.1 transcription initiation factor TFIID [Paenibacillus taichungensis]HBU81059.1 transcription initiation factor TFIID [Paenibacillus sp.]